jgi:CIC family chloride channel protein
VHGIVAVANAHVEGLDETAPAASLAKTTDKALIPAMSIKEAMHAFDETESDTLAVVDSREQRHLIGTLSETYVTRRYAEEMERAQML